MPLHDWSALENGVGFRILWTAEFGRHLRDFSLDATTLSR